MAKKKKKKEEVNTTKCTCKQCGHQHERTIPTLKEKRESDIHSYNNWLENKDRVG